MENYTFPIYNNVKIIKECHSYPVYLTLLIQKNKNKNKNLSNG